MILALRLLLAVFALALLAVGAAFAFAPQQVAPDFAIAITGVAGYGTLRANLGAGFAALGLFMLAALRPGQARWLVVPLVFLGAILALRLLHLALDGFSDAGLRSTGVEVVLVAVLAIGWRVLRAPARAA
jgi:hypothetical protein